jgi:hypothetical protein
MKTRRYIGCLAALAIAWTAAAQQPAATATGTSAAGNNEVVQLRLELTALRLEFLTFQERYLARLMASLQGEFQWIQARREKVEANERRLQSQLGGLDQQLRDPATSELERRELKELEASRNLQPGSELALLLAEKDSLVRREADLSQQIQFERDRLETAHASLGALQAELARTLGASQKPAR